MNTMNTIIHYQIEQPRIMDKFPETYNLPRMKHDEAEYLNRPFTNKEIPLVIKNITRNTYLGPDGFTRNFYWTFKELILILLKLFQKIKERGPLQTHFMKPALPKSDKDVTRRENYWPISLMNVDAKIFNKILAKQI